MAETTAAASVMAVSVSDAVGATATAGLCVRGPGAAAGAVEDPASTTVGAGTAVTSAAGWLTVSGAGSSVAASASADFLERLLLPPFPLPFPLPLPLPLFAGAASGAASVAVGAVTVAAVAVAVVAVCSAAVIGGALGVSGSGMAVASVFRFRGLRVRPSGGTALAPAASTASEVAVGAVRGPTLSPALLAADRESRSGVAGVRGPGGAAGSAAAGVGSATTVAGEDRVDTTGWTSDTSLCCSIAR